jgi:uncharacterized protein YhbP (UPF0306 family)
MTIQMTEKPIPDKTPTEAELAQGRQNALALIQRQRTMVLATRMGQASWAAPVYYVYVAPGFYFFSAPRSVHIIQALDGPASAAAIYADGDRLEQIEGVQMTGPIAQVKKRLEQIKITTRFLSKLPLAKALLGDPRSAIDVSQKTNLYRFTPEKIYYMDNRASFGGRFEIDL